jgi:hypothetical protein
MTTSRYNNLPPSTSVNSDSATLAAFDNFYNQPLEIKVSTFDAMTAFFTARGFDETAAQSVTVIIIKQAKKDNINPLQILDSLKGLDNVEISALVAEIINYNRFKTSFLGYSREFVINEEVSRNVLP